MHDALPPARYNPTWSDLGGYIYQGAILGNGVMGALVHRQDADRWDGNPHTLLWQINRTDLVDSCPRGQEGFRWSRMAVGRCLLRPRGAIRDISMRLDLAAAELTSHIHTDHGSLVVRSLVLAERDVLLIAVECQGEETISAFDFAADPSGVIVEHGAMDYQESARYQPLNPPAIRQETDGVHSHHQALQAADRWWRCAWGGRGQGPCQLFAVALCSSHPQQGTTGDAEALVQQALDAAPQLQHAHRDWWQRHYAHCQLSIPDPELEAFWWLQQYQLGASMRADGPLKDLTGPWYVHSCWRAIWWNWNTQAMFAPIFHANRVELLEPLARVLEQGRAQLAANLPASLRNNGALGLGRASWIDLDAPIDPQDGPPLYCGREIGNLTWLLASLVRAGDCSGDPRWYARALPLLRGTVALYEQLAEPDQQVILHLPVTFSPEYRPTRDCSYDLALFAWSLRCLMRLDPDAPETAHWRSLAARLAPLPQNATGVRIGAEVDLEDSHRHFSHLIGWWIGDRAFHGADARLLERSLQHWLSLDDALTPWSHAAAALLFARLGQGQVAHQQLQQFLTGLCWPCALYREAGMCSETPHAGCAALQELLIQDHDGELHCFPALPPDWQAASFRGFAAAGAVVDASWQQGRVQELSLLGKRSGPITLHCPDHPEPIHRQLITGQLLQVIHHGTLIDQA